MRPFGPVPVMLAGSMPFLCNKRRTTGDIRCESAPAATSSDLPASDFGEKAEVVSANASEICASAEVVSEAPDTGEAAIGSPIPPSSTAEPSPLTTSSPASSSMSATPCSATSPPFPSSPPFSETAAPAETAPSAASSCASRVPTSTVSPSGTRISDTTPATGAGTSVSTLSVETS